MLRRYWPPTSNSACVICPNEQTRTASISTSKTFSSAITAWRWRFPLVLLLKIAQTLQLRLLLGLARADELELLWRRVTVRAAEGVDADDRVGAVVLLVLVIKRLLLDLAALKARLHRARHAAAARDRFELLQHRFLDEVGQLLHQEGALVRVLVPGDAPFLVDDELDRHRAAYRFLGRRGDRLVIGVGVQ